MEEKYTTQNGSLTCNECKNDFEIKDSEVGDIVECPHCGIEYEVSAKNGDEFEVQIIEEEK